MFAALVAAQAAHSIEEYTFALWDVWPIAYAVSSFFSSDIPTGFAIVNASFVAFGVACYLLPVRRQWPSSRAFGFGWSLLELANGAGHLLLAFGAGGYFPGVYTAPFLLAFATVLTTRLIRERANESEARTHG